MISKCSWVVISAESSARVACTSNPHAVIGFSIVQRKDCVSNLNRSGLTNHVTQSTDGRPRLQSLVSHLQENLAYGRFSISEMQIALSNSCTAVELLSWPGGSKSLDLLIKIV